MAIPIAVQLYSVRDDANADMYGTLKKVKDMGYAGVEFAGLYGHSAEEVKTMCEEIGLTPVSAHVGIADFRNDCDKVLDDYAAIGCKFIAVPWLKAEDRPGGSNWDKTLADIIEIGKKAKERGMTLLYHNHDFEFEKLDGKYLLDILYETVSSDILQTELDTCWVNVGGEDPAKFVEKYAGRAPVVHLKDFYGEKSEEMYELIGVNSKPVRPSNFELRPVGSGVQDVLSILKASEVAGAEWVVVEQDTVSMGLTALESIEKSRKYIGSLGF